MNSVLDLQIPIQQNEMTSLPSLGGVIVARQFQMIQYKLLRVHSYLGLRMDGFDSWKYDLQNNQDPLGVTQEKPNRKKQLSIIFGLKHFLRKQFFVGLS